MVATYVAIYVLFTRAQASAASPGMRRDVVSFVSSSPFDDRTRSLASRGSFRRHAGLPLRRGRGRQRSELAGLPRRSGRLLAKRPANGAGVLARPPGPGLGGGGVPALSLRWTSPTRVGRQDHAVRRAGALSLDRHRDVVVPGKDSIRETSGSVATFGLCESDRGRLRPAGNGAGPPVPGLPGPGCPSVCPNVLDRGRTRGRGRQPPLGFRSRRMGFDPTWDRGGSLQRGNRLPISACRRSEAGS